MLTLWVIFSTVLFTYALVFSLCWVTGKRERDARRAWKRHIDKSR